MLQHVRAWLKYRGITQKNVAGTLGVSEPTVSKWLGGKQAMTIGQFAALAELLKATPEELLLPPDQSDKVDVHRRASRVLDKLDDTRTEQWLAVGEAMSDRT